MKRLAVRILLLALMGIGAGTGVWMWSGFSVPEAPAWVGDFSELQGASLVDTFANRLGGDLRTLGPFFDRLAAVRSSQGAYALVPSEEVVPVLHIGDSHVQGGFFPDRVRVRLQACFGNAGRGLLTPYRLMKTNQPAGYGIASPNDWEASRCIEASPQREVGLTGTALSTRDQTIEFTLTTSGEPFLQATLFHHPQAPLLEAGDQASEIGCPLEDTPTVTHVALRGETCSVTLRGDLSQAEYDTPVYYGFSLENGRCGVLYHSVGINGNTFTAVARNPQMIAQGADLAPALVILSLGTNDAYGGRFDPTPVAARLAEVIALCRQYLPGCPVLLTTPMECCSRVRIRGRYVRQPNPNLLRVREAILEAARREGLPYWDFYAAAGGVGAMGRWADKGLARPDRVHLTSEGYTLQGEMLAQALLQAYFDEQAQREASPFFP